MQHQEIRRLDASPELAPYDPRESRLVKLQAWAPSSLIEAESQALHIVDGVYTLELCCPCLKVVDWLHSDILWMSCQGPVEFTVRGRSLRLVPYSQEPLR